MRQKRAKAYKKQINVYVHTFKFREPFQTIVDAELVETCHSASFDIAKGLNRTIQAEAKPMITQCCMEALYKTKNQSLIEVAKKFERRRCNHREPIEPNACIESITVVNGTNKHRYIVASQNLELRKTLRMTPGIPLIYMNRSVMIMEPLSKASAKYSETVEKQKLTGGLNDAKIGLAQDQVNEEPKGKKRKGPKGPNPLSVKKKKKNDDEQTQPEKTKRKRTHKKKTDHNEENGHNEENEYNSHESNGVDNQPKTDDETIKIEKHKVDGETNSVEEPKADEDN